jgi:class 3 adenylate cyclase
VQHLVSYLPPSVVRRFAARPEPLKAPEMERIDAAILFADISGFTSLAEQLAQEISSARPEGGRGAEALSNWLNTYFERLISLVDAHGGEVVGQAGDALIACWPALLFDEPLTVVTRRTAQCAVAIQASLHNYLITQGTRLSLRIGIGAGVVSAVRLGGVADHWMFLLTGTPLVQMGRAQQQA